MKTYMVFVRGDLVGMIKAVSHNAAEKKAQAKYKDKANNPSEISVEYTEV